MMKNAIPLAVLINKQCTVEIHVNNNMRASMQKGNRPLGTLGIKLDFKVWFEEQYISIHTKNPFFFCDSSFSSKVKKSRTGTYNGERMNVKHFQSSSWLLVLSSGRYHIFWPLCLASEGRKSHMRTSLLWAKTFLLRWIFDQSFLNQQTELLAHLEPLLLWHSSLLESSSGSPN